MRFPIHSFRFPFSCFDHIKKNPYRVFFRIAKQMAFLESVFIFLPVVKPFKFPLPVRLCKSIPSILPPLPPRVACSAPPSIHPSVHARPRRLPCSSPIRCRSVCFLVLIPDSLLHARGPAAAWCSCCVRAPPRRAAWGLSPFHMVLPPACGHGPPHRLASWCSSPIRCRPVCFLVLIPDSLLHARGPAAA